jgi:GDP-D-mannose dehydratase
VEISNYYKIYPNPSNNVINIDLRDSKNEPVKSSTISGTIYDLIGQSRIQVNFIENKATADVSQLPKGVYVLKIFIDGVVESHQVIVQ